MKKGVLYLVVLIFTLLTVSLLSAGASHAAPGDFLFQWGAQQHFIDPWGLAVDGNGNVYVTDIDKIHVFNSSGTRTATWGSYGSGDGQFSYPYGIAAEGGRVYVADPRNGRIQVFTSNGEFLGKWLHPDWSTTPPFAIAGDGKGTFYVAESGENGAVKVFDSGGNFIRQLEAIPYGEGYYLEVGGVAVDAEGYVYVSSTLGIVLYGPDGKFIKDVYCCDIGPTIAVDGSGNIYSSGYRYDAVQGVSHWGVRVMDKGGNVLKSFWSDVGPEQEQDAKHWWEAIGLAVDAKGLLYTVDFINDGVRVFDTQWAELPQWWSYGARKGELSRPRGLAIDSSGNVYESDGHDDVNGIRNNRVQVFDRNGTSVAKWTGNFAQTSGVAVDDSGNVHVLDTSNPDSTVAEWRTPTSIVKVFDSSGNFLRGWGNPGPNPDFYAIVMDINGNFLISDRTNSAVQIYDKSGSFLRNLGSAGSGDGQFNKPAGITVDAYGDIFVVDSGNSRVQKFSAAYEVVGKWGGAGSGDGQFSNPAGITADRSGHLFVADTGNNRIEIFDGSGRFLGKWGSKGDAPGLFNAPEGVAVDRAGERVYVADTRNNRINVFQGYGTALYSMSGTVRQGSETGALLAGATVSIGEKTATTSDTGTFSITDILPGSYTLTVSKPGYLTKTTTGYVINGNQSALVFSLTQVTAYVMTGSVREGSTSGPPLDGATVAVGDLTTTTDGSGKFNLATPAGTYTLTVSKPGFATKTVTGFTVSGDSRWIFYLKKGYSLSGAVYRGSSSGPAIEAATVSIAGRTARTSSTGTFTVEEIPAGSYTLTISKAGYFASSTEYTASSDTSGAVFFLTPQYCTISGTVHDGSAAGPLLEGATVSIAGMRAVTSSDGTFSITGLPCGAYTVSISRKGYLTNSITGYAISSDVSDAAFHLTAATYSISGTIREGSSTGPVLEGATVSVGEKTATTGSAGTFTVESVPAGTYTVSISKTGYATKTVTGFVLDRNKTLSYYLLRN